MESNKNKIFLSIDLDDWYHTPAITGSSFAIYKTVDDFFNNWNKPYDFITDSTIKILDLLKRNNISATFFVISDLIDRYPKLIKALKESNHEIGCHSHHHFIPFNTKSKKQTQSSEEWEKELVNSKNILEKAFEREIIGYRAPGAFFANWMVPIIERNGFKYDSSISYNSLYNKTNVVLSEIPQNPYYLNSNDLSNKNSDTKLIEFPWATWNLLGYRFPVAGSFFFRALGYNFFKYVIQKNLQKWNTMFYFHSVELTEDIIPLVNHKKRPLYWIRKGNKNYINICKLIKYYNSKFTNYTEYLKLHYDL